MKDFVLLNLENQSIKPLLLAATYSLVWFSDPSIKSTGVGWFCKGFKGIRLLIHSPVWTLCLTSLFNVNTVTTCASFVHATLCVLYVYLLMLAPQCPSLSHKGSLISSLAINSHRNFCYILYSNVVYNNHVHQFPSPAQLFGAWELG